MKSIFFLLSSLLSFFSLYPSFSSCSFALDYGPYPSDAVAQKFWNVVININADLYYQTNYTSGPGPMNFGNISLDKTTHYEVVALESQAMLLLNFVFTVLSLWSFNLNGMVQLFDIVPYGMFFWVARPVANKGQLTLGWGGYYQLNLVAIQINWKETMSSLRHSLADMMMGNYKSLMPTLYADKDVNGPWLDPYWQFDFVGYFSPNSTDWYGQQVLWSGKSTVGVNNKIVAGVA
jgi:hypothetical protein